MRILQENTVCVVVDIQERLLPYMSEYDLFRSKCARLLEGLNALDVPVLVTQQYTKGLGDTVSEIKQLVEGNQVIEKISFSCCDVPEFMEALRATEKVNVIVIGIESHVCVMQTVIDLLGEYFQPVVVSDCVSSRSQEDKRVAIERMRQEGAIITTYESILFELTRGANAPQFKTISGIVK